MEERGRIIESCWILSDILNETTVAIEHKQKQADNMMFFPSGERTNVEEK